MGRPKIAAYTGQGFLQNWVRVTTTRAFIDCCRWQTEALRRQGADPSLGGQLADLFFRAGIEIVETGPVAAAERRPSAEELQLEWAVIESDLAGFANSGDLHKMRHLDEAAWARGDRELHVPTYFAWGRV